MHGMTAAMGLGMTSDPAPLTPSIPVDTSKRFVRVLELRPDGLVVFEFAIGWPELAVELVLPSQAFTQFCAHHQAQLLDRCL